MCRSKCDTYSCKKCQEKIKIANRKRRRTVKGMLKESLDRAKRSLGRTRKIDCDLTFEQLQQLYTDQNGCCAVTDTPMTSDIGDPLCLSVDRIDSNLGYTLSNIMIVCRWVNLARGSYPLEDFKNRVLIPLQK